MKTYAIFFAGLFCLCVWISPPANAAALPDLTQQSTASALMTPIALQCVRIMRRGNAETLVNNCGSCQIVAVTRKRTGIAIPILRSFTIHDGIPFTLPFRGPGNSRITSVHNCKDEAAEAQKTAGATQPAIQCVKMVQTPTGTVVLSNGCAVCRAAAIQRLDLNGRIMNREVYKLGPRNILPVSANGAARVGLIADIDCP